MKIKVDFPENYFNLKNRDYILKNRIDKPQKIIKMKIKDLYNKIKSFQKEDEEVMIPFCIEDVFSWRGIYAEPCFEISTRETSVSENLRMIKIAITEVFTGYKGGEYVYTLDSPVNFEAEDSNYTDGEYIDNFIKENIDNPVVKEIFGEKYDKYEISDFEKKELKKCCFNCMRPTSKEETEVYCFEKNPGGIGGKMKVIENPAEFCCDKFEPMNRKRCSYCICFSTEEKSCYHFNNVSVVRDSSGRARLEPMPVVNEDFQAESCSCYIEKDIIAYKKSLNCVVD